MRAKTNTGSQNAFKREQSSTSAVNLGGNTEIKPTSNTLFDFYRINLTKSFSCFLSLLIWKNCHVVNQ